MKLTCPQMHGVTQRWDHLQSLVLGTWNHSCRCEVHCANRFVPGLISQSADQQSLWRKSYSDMTMCIIPFPVTVKIKVLTFHSFIFSFLDKSLGKLAKEC